MSMVHWSIVGYGLSLNNIHKYINPDKIKSKLATLNVEYDDEEEVLESDIFCGDPYYYIAEFLCDLDETNTLSFDTNGDGNEYLFYPRIYPWSAHENEAETEAEAADRIAKVICQVYDMVPEDVYEKLDYLDEEGWG